MKFAGSLRKNIMETIPGKILNKFKGRSSRSVVFFEDILANYIKECEARGYDEELANMVNELLPWIPPVVLNSRK